MRDLSSIPGDPAVFVIVKQHEEVEVYVNETMIHAKINYKGHLDYACEEAANTCVSFARMVPIIGGPRLLAEKWFTPLLLYAAPVRRQLEGKYDLPLSGVKGVQCL